MFYLFFSCPLSLSISTPEVYILTSGKESEIRSSTPCSFLQPPVTSFLLHANIVLSHPRFLSIPTVTDQVQSHTKEQKL